MKVQMLAATLCVGGVFISGCSSSDRAVTAAPGVVTPSGIIRSQGDLQRYLAATARSGSPLGALSPGARERFLSSITFNEKGITRFHYGDLQSELTASQIHAVLSLFGVQRDLALIPNVRVQTAADKRVRDYVLPPQDGGGDGSDYKGYWCSSRATCSPLVNNICTSNC